jgi:hypothetical protein
VDTLTAVRLYLKRLHRGATVAQREERLQELLVNPPAPPWYLPDEAGRLVQATVVSVWRQPTLANAQAYVRVVLNEMRSARALEQKAE